MRFAFRPKERNLSSESPISRMIYHLYQQDLRGICGRPSGRIRSGCTEHHDDPMILATIRSVCPDSSAGHCPRDGDTGRSCGSFGRLCDRHSSASTRPGRSLRAFLLGFEVFASLQLAIEVLAAISPYREQTLLVVERRTPLQPAAPFQAAPTRCGSWQSADFIEHDLTRAERHVLITFPESVHFQELCEC